MSKAKKAAMTLADAWAYNVIVSPEVTEKSTLISQHNQVTFRVPVQATKPQIKAAVEKIFGVKVSAVNTLIRKGKTKRFKGVKSIRSDKKKAVVTLAEGHRIDLTENI